MMPDNADVFRKVAERLYKMTAPRYRANPIIHETEIYIRIQEYSETKLLIWFGGWKENLAQRPTLILSGMRLERGFSLRYY
jgi:hypothetical protein